jgi:hypothetical protein
VIIVGRVPTAAAVQATALPPLRRYLLAGRTGIRKRRHAAFSRARRAAVDLFSIETPVAPDLEGAQLSTLNQATTIGDVRTIIYALCLVVLTTVLLIAANSMTMLVRDRISEVAVMLWVSRADTLRSCC